MMRREVEELFSAVMDLPRQERDAYLDRECPDANVRREVEALIEYDARAENFLDQTVQDAARSVSRVHEVAIGDVLGPYRVSSLIGRGGMGSVYRAERQDGQFAHTVAIKVLQGRAWRESMARRFQEERKILARLSHPNIAGLLDGGATPQGLPYYVMEYVDGLHSGDWAAGKSQREILSLFLNICDAVAYAHRRLIVHRDIKPDNILVSREGTAKLLDFGIARALGEETHQTATLAMTLEYASPEQLTGTPTTTASDIYSLGCVLYRLLCGKPPFSLTQTAPAEVIRLVCDTAPSPPPGLDRDLSAIILQAIEKEPDRRYRSVDDLRADLDRYLRGLPVRARGEDRFYQTRKWLVRHWIPVVAMTAVIVSTTVGLAFSLAQARRAEEARRQAELDRIRAEQSAHEARASQIMASEKSAELERQRDLAQRNLIAAREVAASLTRMADSVTATGDMKGALAIVENWLVTLKPIADAKPADADLRKLAGILELRRCGLIASERPFDAPKICESAIARIEPLLGSHLDDEWLRDNLATGYGVLGKLKAAFGQAPEAERLIRKGAAVLQTHAAAHPHDPGTKRKLASLKLYLAGAILAQKRWQEAVAVYREGAAAIRAAHLDAASRPVALVSAVEGTNFAKRLRPFDAATARTILAECLSNLREYAEAPSASVLEWNEFANALNECAEPSLMQPAEALRFAAKAVEGSKRLDPKALDTLAWAHFRSGDKAKAADTMRQALALTPAAPKTPLRAMMEIALRQFEK
ncbi:MAG: protein kinase [Bryobacterales bacterium]|nr:protein kinase [Bryobacterales bacterium]